MSGAFAELRRLLPTHPLDKKLSKSEILKLSIKYIRLLQGVLRKVEGCILSQLLFALHALFSGVQRGKQKKMIKI